MPACSVLPFILVLSVTGPIYMFKPLLDLWEERNFLGLGTESAVSADAQLAAAPGNVKLILLGWSELPIANSPGPTTKPTFPAQRPSP